VRFNVVDALLQLAGTHVPDRPLKIEGIPVNRKFIRLYILHGTGWGATDGVEIGQLRLRYEDQSETVGVIPIVHGEDVRGWVYGGESKPVTRGHVAWVGSSGHTRREDQALRLYLTAWENPHPTKKVACIDYVSANTHAAPFCVAMTIEEVAADKRTHPLEE
jgi:hypothetical protein